MPHDLSRRSFLAASAAAAVPLTLAARTLAAPGQIRVGLIGMESRNRRNLASLLTNSRVRVTAICDDGGASAEQCSNLVHDRSRGGQSGAACRVYATRGELLACSNVDAVIIATPTRVNSAIIVDACIAGKDIFCDGPLATTVGQARHVTEHVQQHARVLQCGHGASGFCAGLSIAADLVRAGRLGELHAIYSGVPASNDPLDCPNLIDGFGRRYGDLWTILPRILDIDSFDALEVQPGDRSGTGQGARIRFASGVEFVDGGPEGITLIGERGMIYIKQGELKSEPECIVTDSMVDAGRGLARSKSLIDNWLDCITTRQKPVCDVVTGAALISVGHILQIANETGQRLEWNHKAWVFRGEGSAQANALRNRIVMDGERFLA